jgi:hypothetical protein
MLRLDVGVPDDDPAGYRVPADNPFVGQDGVLGEIWDAGLRNPWRYSFDDPARGGTGALIIGDVGQDQWEEFDYEPAGRGGRNYGWRNREGANDYVTTLPPWFEPLTDPTYQYPHDGAPKAIIGGYVYRGKTLGADFVGRYFFGDFMTGRVWSVQLDVDPASGEATAGDLRDHSDDIGPEPIDYFATFGQDAGGELYVVSWFHGTVYRLAPGPAPAPTPTSDLQMNIDSPAAGGVRQPFVFAGWALDLGATSDAGVGSVQITAFPTSGTPQGLGPAQRIARPDVAAAFGPQFSQSGFQLLVSGLSPGHYRIAASAGSTVVSAATLTKSVEIDVLPGTQLAIDQPQAGATIQSRFTLGGWALDLSAPSGTGVDAVHVWAYPADGSAARFLAVASYGQARPDVAALYGSQFLNSGWQAPAVLNPGDWTIVVFVHSSLTGQFVLSETVPVHVAESLLLQLDAPSPEQDIPQNAYVAGWALDLASDGIGVDAVHVWAFPTDGSPPQFLGYSTLGGSRPDVAAVFGAQFMGSGFTVPFVLPAGTFDLCVFAHRSSTGSFDAVRVVRVHVQ